MVKFVAQYRAHKDARALNEIASTLFFLFAGVRRARLPRRDRAGVQPRARVPHHPAQAETGKWILLIIGVNVALNFPFSVYGGVSSGFQRYDINNMVAIGSNLVVAAVNVAVVLAGYGLVALVAATTLVRFVTYFIYRRNAYKVFPALRIRPSSVPHGPAARGDRASASTRRSSTGRTSSITSSTRSSSASSSAPAPVAIWAVAERIISGTQRLTNQVNAVLFPVVVDSRRHAAARPAPAGPARRHAAVAGHGAADRAGAGACWPSR